MFNHGKQGDRQAEEVEEITDPEKLQRIFEVRIVLAYFEKPSLFPVPCVHKV